MRLRNWAGAMGVVGLTGFLVTAIVLMSVALAQPPKSDSPAKLVTAAAAEPTKPADALGTMLGDARAAHAKLRDYTSTYTRQERINGILSAEQVGEMKVRLNPTGVYVRFARPE